MKQASESTVANSGHPLELIESRQFKAKMAMQQLTIVDLSCCC